MLLGKDDGLFSGARYAGFPSAAKAMEHLFRDQDRFLAHLRASAGQGKKAADEDLHQAHHDCGMASPAPSEDGHYVPGRSLSSSGGASSFLGRASSKEALKRKWGRESSEEEAVVPHHRKDTSKSGNNDLQSQNVIGDVHLLRASKDGVVAVKRMRARSNSSLNGEAASSTWSPSSLSAATSTSPSGTSSSSASTLISSSSSSSSSWPAGSSLPGTPVGGARGASASKAPSSPQPHSRFIFPWLLRNAVASDSGPHRQGLGLFAATHRGVLVRMDHKALLGSQLAEAGLVRQYRKTAALHSQEEIDRHHFEALRRQLELYGFRQVRNPGLSCPQGFLLYEFKFDFPATFPANVPWIEKSDEVVNLMISYYRTSKEGLKTQAKQPVAPARR
jgi:hypothetical protein